MGEGKILWISPEENRFQSSGEFKWCIFCGGAVEFSRRGKAYGVVRYGKDGKITAYAAGEPASEITFDTADEALEFPINGERLRDIITKVEVTFRSI